MTIMEITVTTRMRMMIDRKDLFEFQKDLRQWKIKHEPFRSWGNRYQIDLIPSPKVSWLVLKYNYSIESLSK